MSESKSWRKDSARDCLLLRKCRFISTSHIGWRIGKGKRYHRSPCRVRVMATGTNWKRPWEEEHDGGTGYRSRTSHAVEQSSHSALRTTPLSEERDQPAPQSKELRFVPTSNGTTIFSPSPSRRVDFLPRDNAGAQSPGRPEYSPYLPNKRQRTNCPRRGHNYYPRGGASRSVHGVHNVQEEGRYSPR